MGQMLVIDDMHSNANVMTMMLNEIGYNNVRTFYSATEALRFLGIGAADQPPEEEIEMIFIDMLMPEISGEEVCRIIRTDQRFAMTPIVITTGLVMSLESVLESGANELLIKPIDTEQIKAVINRYIEPTR